MEKATFEHIPLVDLRLQTAEIRAEIVEGIEQVIERCNFVLGDEVRTFEESFAEYCAAKHCVGVGNGTDALELSLRAAQIGPGDEVILPANSFVASASAVMRCGATPALVDVDPTSLLLDVDAAAARVNASTRGIMPVHLYGQMARMKEVMELADSAGLIVVEDAAQAQGSSQQGTGIGGWGLVAATSFYPGKNLGAFGDGGAIITNSSEIAHRVQSLRNHGSQVKYEHPELGFNSRLDTLQAVVLLAKLKRLSAWNEQRQRAAEYYDELLEDIEGVERPVTVPGNVHVWHLYVVQVANRDKVLQGLNERGIGAGIHYPIPIHLQGAFTDLGHRRGDFPVTEHAADRLLSLPIYPGITPDQQERVASCLAEVMEQYAALE